MKPLLVLTRLALLSTAAIFLAGCGAKLSGQSRNTFARAIVADASMRQVLNRKWTCSHTDNAANGPLPYRKLTIFNDGDSQSLQLVVHYADTEVPTVDLLQVEQLDCYYSTADSRVVKCASRADPTFKLESSVAHFYDQQYEVLTVTMTGAERAFSIYLGGHDNRPGTLAEFKQRYRDPFQIRVNTPDTCGFQD
jgi:hypothetical protein